MREFKALWWGAVGVNFSVHNCQRWCKGSVLFYLFSLHLPPALERSKRSGGELFSTYSASPNYLHHASRLIIDILTTKQIGTVVIGKNAQWKTEIELGKQTNQNFVSIPHARLIEMLEYKARLVGIKVIVQQESYTSRAIFLGLDSIPVYGKTDKDPVFTGKRIKRGLYKTSVGQLINCDLNAAYNILRKAIPNALSNGIGSCVVRTLRGSIRSK